MRVAIVGTGYVGLVTGVCLAEKGHDVVCVDVDVERVARVNAGEPPIYEAGLEELLRSVLAGGCFGATSDLRAAVRGAELTLIAVGTPFDGERIDLSFVEGAAREIGAALAATESYHVVVVKSTVVPGTTTDVVLPLLEEVSGKRAGADFGVGMNPEFLTEGTALADFLEPDRIVLGGIDERTLDALAELYAGFPGVPVVRTNPSTAELVKYASNALLATLISFSNEIADLGAAVGGIDVVDVMRGVHASRYLTVDGQRAPISSFLEAGCGFGGSCLPKDVSALAAQGRQLGVATRLLEATLAVNGERADALVRLVAEHVPLAGARIAVLGLAFKPDTDDVRETPAVPVIERLVAAGATVVAHDPVVERLPARLAGLDAVMLEPELTAALDGAAAAVLVTRWDAYQELPELLARLDPPPLLVDGRRVIAKDSVPRYAGIGAG